MDDSNLELESFRNKWRAEVSARTKVADSKRHEPGGSQGPSHPSKPAPRRPSIVPKTSTTKKSTEEEEEEEEEEVSEEEDGHSASKYIVDRRTSVAEDADLFSKASAREPRSALEHYERAVEKETQGSLGESLSLYRKAFRMDDAVDQKYRKKHFPPSYFASKPTNVNPSNNAPSAVPSTAKPALDGPPQSINDLISSFVGLSITPAPPEIEGTPPWPCPIAALPDEILIKVLTELAILDILSFVRCAQVCKVFAFFVSNEEQIWKRVCLGSEVGFGGMHYTWQTEVDGGHLLEDNTEVILDQAAPASVQASIVNTVPTANTTTPPAVIQAADTLVAPATAAVAATIPVALPNITTTLLISLYSSSYRLMFRNRPRIRFNGCYISTVNYIRPGQAAPSQLTWGSPVHIVTYYRYLRFFRNGTVISLLTTSEPTEIVHVLTPTLLDSRPGPTSLVHNALRGRWRLSSVADDPTKSLAQAEGMVFVETEGVGENYVYRMELDIKAVGKTTKSNRLVWKGFWCYNKLTDDWGEFGLRNDKAFVFSRVRRYGTGA